MADDVTPQRDFIFYDKAELRGIIRAFKGLSEEAQQQAKPKELQKVLRYPNHLRSVSFHLDLLVRNSPVEQPLNSIQASKAVMVF
jgi:hypothetical protein